VDPLLEELCTRNVRIALNALAKTPLDHLAAALLVEPDLAERLRICNPTLLSPAEIREWTEGVVAALLRAKTECSDVMREVRSRMADGVVDEMEKATKGAVDAVPTDRDRASPDQ
jgi:hypothetical protein